MKRKPINMPHDCFHAAPATPGHHMFPTLPRTGRPFRIKRAAVSQLRRKTEFDYMFVPFYVHILYHDIE